MGHKKKKVKKEDFENLYKEATRQWLLKASQYPLVRFYVHVQKINKDKILDQ